MKELNKYIDEFLPFFLSLKNTNNRYTPRTSHKKTTNDTVKYADSYLQRT